MNLINRLQWKVLGLILVQRPTVRTFPTPTTAGVQTNDCCYNVLLETAKKTSGNFGNDKSFHSFALDYDNFRGKYERPDPPEGG